VDGVPQLMLLRAVIEHPDTTSILT
jgi:hypothetical protein